MTLILRPPPEQCTLSDLSLHWGFIKFDHSSTKPWHWFICMTFFPMFEHMWLIFRGLCIINSKIINLQSRYWYRPAALNELLLLNRDNLVLNILWKIKMLNIGQYIGLIQYWSTPRSCWLLVTPTPTPWRPLTPWPRPTPAWSTRATWACAPTTSGPRSPASQSAQTRNQFQFYTNNINWYKLIQRCCQINFSNSWK